MKRCLWILFIFIYTFAWAGPEVTRNGGGSYDGSDVTITGGTITGVTDIAVADGGTGASTAEGARTNLGLGSMATQDSTNVSITGGTVIYTFDEILQPTSDTLTVAELRGQRINNYGQGAANNLQILPTAAEGMHFVATVGTAQAANYYRFQADTNDKIYLDGVAGDDSGYVTIAVPVVGARIAFETFQTGVGTWDWFANTIHGNWVAGNP